MNLLGRLYWEEDGQGLTEYVLIVSLVSVALIAGLIGFKAKLISSYGNLGNLLP